MCITLLKISIKCIIWNLMHFRNPVKKHMLRASLEGLVTRRKRQHFPCSHRVSLSHAESWIVQTCRRKVQFLSIETFKPPSEIWVDKLWAFRSNSMQTSSSSSSFFFFVRPQTCWKFVGSLLVRTFLRGLQRGLTQISLFMLFHVKERL